MDWNKYVFSLKGFIMLDQSVFGVKGWIDGSFCSSLCLFLCPPSSRPHSLIRNLLFLFIRLSHSFPQ